LVPKIAELKAEIDLYKKGNKKENGRWISLADYNRREAAIKLAEEKRRAEENAAAEAWALKKKCEYLERALAEASDDLKKSESIVAELAALKCPDKRIQEKLACWNKEQKSVVELKEQ